MYTVNPQISTWASSKDPDEMTHKYVSEYDQGIPQLHTADKPTTP